MRIVSAVPAGIVTFTGTGAGGGGGTAETVGPEGAGAGVPAATGVTVVVVASVVWPEAGGCTTVVVVVPVLSTVTTCCAWPVFAACCLARSSAFSSFEAHPQSNPIETASTAINPSRTDNPDPRIVAPSRLPALFIPRKIRNNAHVPANEL